MGRFNPLRYCDHEGTVHEVVGKFHKSTGIPYDDLLAEAMYKFVRATQGWDPDGDAGFNHYLYRVLENGLRDFIRKNRRIVTLPPPEDGQDGIVERDALVQQHTEWHPQIALRGKDLVDSLSHEAQQVARILLTAPAEILELVGTESPREVRGRIVEHLREQDWSWPSIWRAFKELKEKLR